MSTSATFSISPFASRTVTQLDRVLHHDQRGGERTINGKPSYTVQQAADEITRDNYRWYDTNGDGKTDVTYEFRTTAGPLFSALGLSGFSEFNQAQKDSARQAMDQWSDMANVRFTEKGQGGRERAVSALAISLKAPGARTLSQHIFLLRRLRESWRITRIIRGLVRFRKYGLLEQTSRTQHLVIPTRGT